MTKWKMAVLSVFIVVSFFAFIFTMIYSLGFMHSPGWK